jgi:serine-type D-Ala-D-Ala carboxypeptidase (penicillin-binding protein 5/6)
MRWKGLKRGFSIIRMLLLVMIGITTGGITTWADFAVDPPDLAPGARAAILMDAGSGRVLYQKQADKELPIASITKIMTAILAIEHGQLDVRVAISPNAVGVEGSSIYLQKGEKVPLRSLLYGLMYRSGNDAAVAIAEHIGGSVGGFVHLMNEKAEILGMNHSHFVNPHGLDHPDHYSSAEDMARLTAYAMKNLTFKKIVSNKAATVPWPGEKWGRKFYNKDRLLSLYKYANGVKTGFTKKSGRTLVSAALKENVQLIGVTLNDGDDWKDSIHMFEYGFMQYKMTSILTKGRVISEKALKSKDKSEQQVLQVVAGKDFLYPLREEERSQITVKPIITYPLRRIKQAGMQVGNARIYLRNELIGSIPLVTKYADRLTMLETWKQVLTAFVLVRSQEGGP